MEVRQIIVRLAILLSYYVIGGYATTDIPRLLKGNSLDVSSKDCFCPICNNKIRLLDQIPIFTYVIRRGKCRYCGSNIPSMHFMIETIIFLISSLIVFIFRFRLIAFWVCVIFFELFKGMCICKYGKREKDFIKNAIKSIINNIVVFLFVFILFLFVQQ